jgi:hypothetical protein
VAGAGIDDLVCAPGSAQRAQPLAGKKPVPLGVRWAVEQTNPWLSNFGQLRRNTDRRTNHRLGQFAVAILLTPKRIDWRDQWTF